MSESPGQACTPTDTSSAPAQRADNGARGAPGAPEAAFDALVREVYGDLCDLAFRLTRRRADAEDAVQDVLAAVWRRRDELLRDSGRAVDLRRYLHIAVRNRVRHMAARSATASRHDAQTRLARHEPAAAPAADALLDAGELRRLVQEAVAELPAQQRAVLLLRRFGELSTAEVADTLGVSLKTVENHLGRAMRRLRERLFGEADA